MKKTTQKLLQMLLVLAIASITLNSCEKQRLDGDWDPMEWQDESGLAKIDNVYQVPASGGSYKFKCTNYGGFWISSIEEDGEHYIPHIDSNDWKDLSGQWTRVQCNPNSELVVTIQPIDDTDIYYRSVCIDITAGDIWSFFRFVQKNNAN